MSPEQAKLREIFSEALAKASSEERERYLAAACGQDADLRRQLDSLLEAHGQAGDFLKQNPTQIAPNGPAVGQGPGSVIGRYKLLEQIGEGGFGVVFMAEQREPVRRMVALKILKPGMDTKEVVARFEAGRQALALMDHPNIARVLDGGATDSDRPYFVMELVKGISITEFCEQHQLPVEERLRLFMKVCAGVQHAHQKGVIHRDLKPSNVLVTLHDGEPVPKVIDFGIAKAIGQKLTERTLFTRFEQLLGTPAYMSPEQAEWSGLDIDTRSDLYSLGVLLYELLTSTTPIEKETLARAALDEVRRMIRETEPPKPSTRLSALAAAHSALRAPHSALQKVRGDLDWIVMKALEKDRTRRYETVNGLARDVERHLKGEPVVACPPSKTYLASKFIRKHRLGVAAAAGVALALVFGLVLALVGFAQARRERQRAQGEAATAKAINEFLTKDLLGQASPDNNPNPDLTVREVFDRAAQKINNRFTNQPLVEASIRATLGHAYFWWGENDAAQPHLQRVVEIRGRYLGPDHPDTLGARHELANVHGAQGKYAQAEQALSQIAQTYRRTLGSTNWITYDCLNDLAMVYMGSGRYTEAEEVLRDLLGKERQSLDPADLNIRVTECQLASCAEEFGRHWEAAALSQEALRHARQDPNWQTLDALRVLGISCTALGNYAKATDLLKECVEGYRRRYGPHSAPTLGASMVLATTYGRMAEWGHCAEVCREIAQFSDIPQARAFYGDAGGTAAFLAGDTNGYQRFAAQALAQFAGTTNEQLAQCIAKCVGFVCLLAPDSISNLQPVFQLVDSVPSGAALESKILKGMAEYRRGNLAAALKWFQDWRLQPSASPAAYFSAMIHCRQGDPAGAKAEMAEANQRFDAGIRAGQFGARVWSGRAMTLAIRAEAERLVFGHEVSPRIDAARLESARKQWEPVRRHVNRADELAGQRKWPEASAEFLAALREPMFDWESADRELAQRVGICSVLAGDRRNFEQICRTWFSRLERKPDSWAAYLAVRLCLAGERDVTSDLGQLALKWSGTIDGPSDSLSWGRTMLAYRSGQYQDAIKHAKAAETSTRLGTRIAAHVFRAMALGKSGDLEQGKKELAQAEAQLGPYLTNMTGDVWWDLGLCQLALDEAHELFNTTKWGPKAQRPRKRQ